MKDVAGGLVAQKFAIATRSLFEDIASLNFLIFEVLACYTLPQGTKNQFYQKQGKAMAHR